MARDVKINGVTYTGVSVVQVPMAEGGAAGELITIYIPA